MNLFDVYTLWDIEPVKASGTKVWDSNGIEYLDLYGGHAVISIGHCHPTYTSMLHAQLDKLGFYSNAVQNSLQRELAEELGNICGYPQYSLFLCNSGAEANENAMKAASFQTGRKRILAIGKAFHGRTSGAVEATDNPKIQAPFNRNSNITFIPINDVDALESNLKSRQYAAFIFEGIQGVAGIYEPSVEYLRRAEELCKETGTILIADEVQSGCGRTGDFFAHQKSGVKPQIITMAKGTGNGFPIGAVLLSGDIKAEKGMLGTTFGGNHLACTAAIAVMKVLRKENLLENARKMGDYLLNALRGNKAIKELRGRGLMIGIELQPEFEYLRNRLLFEEHIFTGGAGKRVIRLLPPLCISKEDCDRFIEAFNKLTK
ncbi:MAG: aspartate aminotransferase family protein [bacterium]|nr:aspartate aminotransferase family protein [bacterium]